MDKASIMWRRLGDQPGIKGNSPPSDPRMGTDNPHICSKQYFPPLKLTVYTVILGIPIERPSIY
jgi:hypothetical protein